MNFQEAKAYLLTIFQQHHFVENVQNNKKHASQVVIDTCLNGTYLSVSFPGYKAYILGNKIIYDYRVDITKNGITTALSHTNIITDIYNKIVNGRMSADALKGVLIDIAQEGLFDLNMLRTKLHYTSVAPARDLLLSVKKAHGHKMYNELGNAFDWTLEELFCSIKWIVLQEDINYPISKGFEGRKMPFSRYLETLFVTKNSSRTLAQVIERALSHSRPSPWVEMDYTFRDFIK